MSSKTRKHIWPVSLVMSIAIIGAIAAFVVLATVPQGASADGDAPHSCAGMTAIDIAVHNYFDTQENGGAGQCLVDEPTTPTPTMVPAVVHATMPEEFQAEVLDNGARLNWEAPLRVASDAVVVGYRIDRDAYHADSGHPININGDTTIDVEMHIANHSDLGLAYGTTYTYMVQAVVEYTAKGWWNRLSCVARNNAVSPGVGEPAVGSNYCQMYDNLTPAAMMVVGRAYAALPASAYTYYGQWTRERSVTTADSGGRLAALLDPPGTVRRLDTNPSCANQIRVTWLAPVYAGTAPATDDNGVYVGPDYIGGNRAGKEEVGQPATISRYQVARMVNNSVWTEVAPNGLSYTDLNVAYGNTYQYRVRAQNSAGLYGPWFTSMITLVEPSQPLMPTSLNVDPVGGTVELQWDAPEDTVPPLWRTAIDYGRPRGISANLEYVIERKVVGEITWREINRQPHRYADEPGRGDTLTQVYVDESPPVGEVSYRVAALVNDCNMSAYNQKDPVLIAMQPLGDPSGLSALSSAAGMIALTWTPGVSSSLHWVAGIGLNADDTYDYSRTVFTRSDAENAHTVTDLASGDYLFTVIAGESVNGPWSDWTRLQTVTVQ